MCWSVLAQCLGIADWSPIMLVGGRIFASFFREASPFSAGLKFAFLRGVDANPTAITPSGFPQNIFRNVSADVRDHHSGPDHRRGCGTIRLWRCLSSWPFGCLSFISPLAHMVWGEFDGLMNGVWNPRGEDYGDRFCRRHGRATLSSGWSAPCPLRSCSDRGSVSAKKSSAPHSMVLLHGWCWECFGRVGTVLTRGARLARMASRRIAFMTTTLADCGRIVYLGDASSTYWRGKASVLGFCSGSVAGLVVISRRLAASRSNRRRINRPGRRHRSIFCLYETKIVVSLR